MMVCKCDICGRVEGNVDIEHYKLKKKVHNWYESSWDYLDVCTDCIMDIRIRVKKGQEK